MMTKHFNGLRIIAWVFFESSPIQAEHFNNEALSIREWESIQKQLKTNPFKFFAITIPKSGTHLLGKCIRLMQTQNPSAIANKNPSPKPDGQRKKCTQISSDAFP